MISNYIKPYKIFCDMRKNLWLKTSELKEIQEEKLKTLLTHAYQNVPFYRRLFDSVGLKPKDIKDSNYLYKIPAIKKSQIKSNPKDMVARNTDLSSCIEYKTSGSTGINLIGYFTREDALYMRGSYERVRNENGFRMFRDTLLMIGVPNSIPNSNNKKLYEYFGIRRRLGLNVFEPLDVQIQVLIKAKPDALWGYPSTIKILAKVIQEKQIEGISPRLIFTASEVLNSETRHFINSAFNVELFDIYGAWETGCIAWECSDHAGYHVTMDTVLIEFIDGNGDRVNAGERGSVVVTNLHSFAMPIIRYAIGDFAIPSYEECSCGRGGYLIREIEGRYDDFIRLRDGQLISPLTIEAIMEFIPGVSEFQIVQEKEDEFVVYVVKMDGYNINTIIEEIDREFRKILGDNVSISTNFLNSIPRAQSGKLRSVISMP